MSDNNLKIDEPTKDKMTCENCKHDKMIVYITVIVDDARIYCANCGYSVLN